jgi:hypothetical protein
MLAGMKRHGITPAAIAALARQWGAPACAARDRRVAAWTNEDMAGAALAGGRTGQGINAAPAPHAPGGTHRTARKARARTGAGGRGAATAHAEGDEGTEKGARTGRLIGAGTRQGAGEND